MSNSNCLLFISMLFAFESNAQQVDTVKVKVHDHVITLYSSGIGKPTVILEAGGGSNHKETWEKVEAKLASFAKVVSYDRPGYLNSETCNSTRDAVTVAKELKEALTRVGIKPPYILAGWSLGGSFVRVFAGLYPQDVSGLVLVDPAPENSYPLFEKDSTYLAEKKAHHNRLMSSNRVGQKAEWLAFDSSMYQGRRSDAWHATPTTLLIAAGKADGGQNRDTTDPLNRIWVEELIKWGKKRPNLKYKIISNSGHHMARFQPDTVINAVLYHIDQNHITARKQATKPYKKPDQLKDGIQTGTLKEAGLDEKILQTMVDSIVNGNYDRIHSVLILRNNKLVYEQYWPGYDAKRGRGFVGFVDQHRDSLHDQRSISKSFVSAAFMIAMNQGKIKSLDQRVFDFFPEYAKYDTGMKKQITIQHLLNMAAGFEWNENIPYTDPKNSEEMMYNAPDILEFVLSRKLINKPGEKFNYSAGCTQLLATIIQKTTGMPVDKYLEMHLFKPLGIEKYTWAKDDNGSPVAASGLRLRSRDMAKFGMLYMNDGKWNGKQIIPSSSVRQTMKSQINTGDTFPRFPYIGYSNQFWHITEVFKDYTSRFAQCLGNGDQLIIKEKELDLLLIITAGNYNRRGRRKTGEDIYTDFVYPAISK